MLGKESNMYRYMRKTGQRGLTLIELVFTIAIIIVLTALFLPLALDKLARSDEARANSDVDAIATALTTFFTDVKRFPACDSADCDAFGKDNNDLQFLAIGSGTGAISGDYPTDDASLGTEATGAWTLTDNDSATPARNNAYNHLAQNNPNADTAVAEAGSDYVSTKWKGPYIAKLSKDPFAKTYIVGVGAMEKDGSPIISGAKGWILSAGTDGVLQTATTATTLVGDDIGYIFVTR